MFLKADSLLFFDYVKEKEKIAFPDSAPWAQTLNKIHFGKIPYSQNWTRSRTKITADDFSTLFYWPEESF